MNPPANERRNNAQYYQRLDRIEEKIDKLSDAMVSIARAEERIVAIEADRHDHWNRMNSHSLKLDSHEEQLVRLNMSITKTTSILDIVNQHAENDRITISDNLNLQTMRLNEIEKEMLDVKKTTSIVNKITWMVAATATMLVLNSFVHFIPISS